MLKEYIKNLSIRKQLLLGILSLSLISLFITSVLCFFAAARIIGEKAEQYTYENVCQLSDNIDNYLSQIELTSLAIAYNPNIQDFLNSVNKGEDYSRSQLYQLEKSMILKYNYSSMRDISLISLDGNIVSVPHSQEGQYNFVKELNLKPHQALWHNDSSQQLLQMIRHVEGSRNYQAIGTLCISVYNGFINDLSNNIDFGNKGFLTVLDEAGEPIMASGNPENYLKDCRDQFGEGSGDFTHKINGKSYHYFYHTSSETGWRTIGVISLEELLGQIIELGIMVILCLCLVTLVAVFFSRRLAALFSLKIQKVLGAMELASNGDFSARLPVENSTNEFTELNRGFNQMITEINTLIDTVYKAQILQRESEFKALQAEINPHFLYNTLDTICWQAKLSGNEDIYQTTFSLASLLRASVGNQRLFVALEEELSYVGDYIKIQKARYRDRITVRIQIPEELMKYQIPKLILQPVVENAFVHGLEMKRGKGELVISGFMKGNVILLTVQDNGAGMTREQIHHIFCHEENPGKHSIGLSNVQRRLKLLYGEDYGIQIQSVLDEGTKTIITIPAEKERRDPCIRF